MTNTYTWDVYTPFGVGLETIFNRLDSMSGHNTNYPPYNIIRMIKLIMKLKLLLLVLKRKKLRSLRNRTFSELLLKLRNEILKEHISTKDCRSVPSLTVGN